MTMRDALLRRLATRLAPSDPEGIERQLAEAPELQGDLGWLEDLLDASDLLRLRPVPPDLSASLHALIGGPVGPPRIETAAPIHDSRTVGELVGVRGPGDDNDWTMVFSSASADVAIDGSTTAAGTMVAGQVLARVDDSHDPYLVTAAGPERSETWSDELGQFDLGILPPGEYRFSAADQHVDIRWTVEL